MKMAKLKMVGTGLGVAALVVTGWVAAESVQAQTKVPATPAQDEVAPQVDAAAEATVDADAQFSAVLRGPVHEAFLQQIQLNAAPSAVIPTEPPADIDEIPPAVRPAGNNMIWAPGYWAWDEATNDFLWITGAWRSAPPGMRWVPGVWAQVEGGYQWNSGFWAAASDAELGFYKRPPKSLDNGPSSPAIDNNQCWIPGYWEPYNNDYRWHAGQWAPYQRGYLWVPSHYVATSAGYVYVPGYWDYPLSIRGQLFAPIRIAAGARTNGAALRFTPSVAINNSVLANHLFVRAGASTYLFGDYYGDNFRELGIQPWHTVAATRGVVDPVLSFRVWREASEGVDFLKQSAASFGKIAADEALRPAVDLAKQAQLPEVAGVAGGAVNSVLGQPIDLLRSTNPQGFVAVSADQRVALDANLKQLDLVTADRLKVNSAAGAVDLNTATKTAVQLPSTALKLPRATAALAPATNQALPVVKGLTSGATEAVEGVVPKVPGAVPAVPNVVPQVPNVPNVVPSVPNVLPNIGGGLLGD
ncbi:hypothetical protein Psta_0459 [Pirellula staleyi DSM 6068]|uniref:Uncharacterized protein n=1 Tax=Pirellula staleyi (strain ATCC 27377 / DSM 6068 / ICPB 4128) TaxID=530564 RepID=D2R3B6_PIRSD|nr:YXWGXW repeat-containing protein [Pirellula staleyi]ADB15147.1 hypothetical protein Psta_0459 [Pirellula staleyi DSM 6068]